MIGSEYPVVIQTMTSAKTHDVEAVVAEVQTVQGTGCQIIRVSVPDEASALALPKIREQIGMPVVADIHFNPEMAFLALENGADKIRINPGNFKRERLRELITLAKEKEAAMRIGVNSGSVEKDLLEKYGHPSPQALAESALRWEKFVLDEGFENFCVSIKSEDPQINTEANRIFAAESKAPLHIGVTHAGLLLPGAIKNAIGISTLLQEGIGDTIRVSLTASIAEEIEVCKYILKSIGLYPHEPNIVACPTCARCEIDLKKLVAEVKEATAHIKKPIRISVLGCVVNGPGEAKESDFGIAGGKDCGALYFRGKVWKPRVAEADLLPELLKLIEEKLEEL
jgi:(E)-4-hydroxy-3-methylbut-2-enyl-diphosphate synthase